MAPPRALPRVFDGAPPGFAQKTGGVAIVDHDQCVVLFGQVAHSFEVCDDAVHAEYAVGDDQFESRPRFVGGFELGFQVHHVVVVVPEAHGFAKPYSVDDGSVVEGVADDGVLGGEKRFENSSVGVEAGGVEDGVFGAVERRDARLEFFVDVLGSADESHGRHSVPSSVEGFVCGLDDIGV